MLSSVLRNQNKLMTYSSKTEHQRRETTARIVDVWLAQPKGCSNREQYDHYTHLLSCEKDIQV